MSDFEDDEEYGGAADEDAYDMTSVKRQPENPNFGASRPMPMPSRAAEPEDSGPLPEWAAKYQKASGDTERVRLKGTCAKWNTSKGFGFVSRDDGGPDVYVHQRDLKKEGFRSLLEGESVEFELGRMEDGRLYGIKVTGPGGKGVQGQPHKGRNDDDDDGDDYGRGGAGGPTRKADERKQEAPSKAPYKPALAFRPRTLKPKPAPKPKAAGVAAAEATEALPASGVSGVS